MKSRFLKEGGKLNNNFTLSLYSSTHDLNGAFYKRNKAKKKQKF